MDGQCHADNKTNIQYAAADSTLPAISGSPDDLSKKPRIAVLVPCFNEAVAIGKVVQDFRTALPQAIVYVYNNNSSDNTAAEAAAAGAVVRHEMLQGKGHVVRRMFADVEADIYIFWSMGTTLTARTRHRSWSNCLKKNFWTW